MSETQQSRLDPELAKELKGNFNSQMYLLTEIATVLSVTMEKLVEKNVITEEELIGLWEVTGDREKLSKVYGQLFQRFTDYFAETVKAIEKFEEELELNENPLEVAGS